MKRVMCGALFMLIFFAGDLGYAGDDKRLYLEALRHIRAGDTDFAFMNFHMLVENYPQSLWVDDSLFIMGEYYFARANYYDAYRMFSQYRAQFAESKATLFVLAYLFELTCRLEDKAKAKELEKEIATFMRVSLLFRESKEYVFVSPSRKKYKAKYFIDKVEFYINDELFTNATF